MIKKVFLFIVISLCALYVKGQFKNGYYYTKEGEKVSGLLEFNFGGRQGMRKNSPGDCWILFKPEKDSKKITLTPNDICCFIIEKDSFAIVRNFKVNPKVTFPQDFAKVLIKGKINLYSYFKYEYISNLNNGLIPIMDTDWIIEKDGQADQLSKKNFKKVINNYLKDYPELTQQIIDKSLEYKDTYKIVQLYNEHFSSGN